MTTPSEDSLSEESLRELQQHATWQAEQIASLTAEVERLKGYEELYCSEAKDNMNAEKKIASLEAQVNGLREALRNIRCELGVPQPGYPENVTNAYDIADSVLSSPPAEAGVEKPNLPLAGGPACEPGAGA